MSRRTLLTVLILGLVITHSLAGGWNADSLARSIPSRVTGSPEEFSAYLTETFSGEEEQVRALFSWLSANITYDMNQVETMSRFESIDEFVIYTLKNKKAVCQGYAEVFTAICNAMGIDALTVHGYNRVDHKLKSDLGHAWNLAKVNGTWYLFDPTWGSGYMKNGKYVKSFSQDYFMAHPDSLIKTHMPFDPIWQLKHNPLTHDQFIDGESKRGITFCNFSDSLDHYVTLDEIGQAESTLRRAEETHADRREILRMYKKYNDYVINIKCNVEIGRYNESSTCLMHAINRFNEYQELKIKRNPDRTRQRSALERAGLLVQQSLRLARSVSPCRSLTRQEIQLLISQISEVDQAVSNAIRSL